MERCFTCKKEDGHTVTGGAAATIVDYVPSNVHGRRLPIFRNSNKLDASAADTDSLLVTYTVDLRPVLSATILWKR